MFKTKTTKKSSVKPKTIVKSTAVRKSATKSKAKKPVATRSKRTVKKTSVAKRITSLFNKESRNNRRIKRSQKGRIAKAAPAVLFMISFSMLGMFLLVKSQAAVAPTGSITCSTSTSSSIALQVPPDNP
jgi:hypothetical protein